MCVCAKNNVIWLGASDVCARNAASNLNSRQIYETTVARVAFGIHNNRVLIWLAEINPTNIPYTHISIIRTNPPTPTTCVEYIIHKDNTRVMLPAIFTEVDQHLIGK